MTSSSTTAKTHPGSSPFGSPPPNGHHADASHQISCRTTEKPPSQSSCFCTFFLQSPPPSGLLYLLRNLNTQDEVQLLTRAHKHDPPLHSTLTPISISYYAPVTWAIFHPLRIPKFFSCLRTFALAIHVCLKTPQTFVRLAPFEHSGHTPNVTSSKRSPLATPSNWPTFLLPLCSIFFILYFLMAVQNFIIT